MDVKQLCALAGLGRAGFYRRWQAAAPREAEVAVRDAVQRVHLAHPYYGYRRIGRELSKEGWQVNHKRLLRLMGEDNLHALRHRPFVPVTTDSKHGWHVVPNLAYGLIPTGLDQLWVADITYIRMREEFAFLAVVLDAFSRRAIGWALETHLQASLALAALRMAIEQRRPARGLHHSDRGVQYACSDYAVLLAEHGIQASMSRVANPYDNAKAESFIKTLKYEELSGIDFRDVDHARAEIGNFIERVYNTNRLHSALAYRSPAQYEAEHRVRLAIAASAATVSLQGMGKSTAMNSEPAHAIS